MASISTDKSGNRTIQFVRGDGSRTSIRLGKVPLQHVRKVKLHVEALSAAKRAAVAMDDRTADWLRGIDDDLRKKLVAVGLVEPRLSTALHGERPPVLTLGQFLDTYLAKRIDVTAGTREVWERAANNLKAFFGAGSPLANIDEGKAEDFKLFLIGKGLASTTVHKRLEHCRMFMRDAVKRKHITANPFVDVTTKPVMMPGRERYRDA